MKRRFFQGLVFVGTCLLVGAIAGFLTDDAIQTWYVNLKKPFFNPPNWIFGPVWTILYILMGVAGFLVWEKRDEHKHVGAAMEMFWLQLLFNFLWSLIFFGLKNIGFALVDIILLNVLLIICIARFYKIYPKSAYLMVPYLLWAMFATILNGAIALLN